MCANQTYYIISTARTKLGREALRPDHDLRLWVGHVNLLNSLTRGLADAEGEREACFNEIVSKANKPEATKPEATQDLQWTDTLAEKSEDGDSDGVPISDLHQPITSLSTSTFVVFESEVDEDDADEEMEGYKDDDVHALTRVEFHGRAYV